MRRTDTDIYLVRHGRTPLSARHIVNGNPATRVPLDDAGRRQCRDLAKSAPWLGEIATCVTSALPRTQETAQLLLAGRAVPHVAVARLNEIDYGRFEGGPWLRYGDWLEAAGMSFVPPGARESRDGAVRRMLLGLRACLALPGPRLVVGHGLLLSVLMCLASDRPICRAVLEEAPYVAPLFFSSVRLEVLIDQGLLNLDRSAPNRSGPASTDRYAVQVPPTSDLEP
ncbi:MAG: histidine phosphatase family protein [Micromonosporaceae bacterium]